ncbi:hypothetical protein MKW94_002359 [Papaver nudicaule]|uniref:Phosphatidic acid phosphatase type 2/haloperoxidase domain-containing protein n=1 Tax=Papaver nudicaule TaxID=74823 RepID=A0AA41V5N3_PAPNU|nr:hypothetical protein [Papaver nudicaule]MCL7038845.1 hypothetical protein [Papaver nudicaule]
MMDDLRFPFKEVTVKFWVVPLYAAGLPLITLLGFYFRRRDVYDLHHGLLGLLFTVITTGVLTEAIKNATGRPRPYFFWRCFPDGKEVYDLAGDVICHGTESLIRESYKSFPSGHTSWSFAGLGFLSLYLAGKIKAFDQRGHIAKLCVVLLPLLLASGVGITLVDDYWHHWVDVSAGAVLGLTVAIIFYLQFFPPPYHNQGWGPYAYFRMLEQLHNTNSARVEPQREQIDTARNGSQMLDKLEEGKR